jgi:hypothetical protein
MATWDRARALRGAQGQPPTFALRFLKSSGIATQRSKRGWGTGTTGGRAFLQLFVVSLLCSIMIIGCAGPAGPSSQYFEHVKLLETTSISLDNASDGFQFASSGLHDMDGDGIPDAILVRTSYPDNPPHPIVVLNGSGQPQNIAGQLFSNGIPENRSGGHVLFVDIDGDQVEDMLLSEAGVDSWAPPFSVPDASIGIALNRGPGTWENVSSLIPEEARGLRNNAIAAGDVRNEGTVHIILPSQAISGEDPNYSGPDQTGLLSWNGHGFDFEQDWIDMALWWWPENLHKGTFMAVDDLDGDGWQDLYVAGEHTTPTHRVLYGGETFPGAESPERLPEGIYGHWDWDEFMRSDAVVARGADIDATVIADFDGDGDLDLVSLLQDVHTYKPGIFDDFGHPWYPDILRDGGNIYGDTWFQVLRNDGARQFVDVTAQGRDLGWRYYVSLLPIDLDLDGDTDLIGQYWASTRPGLCAHLWGSVILINEGGMRFRDVEAARVFPEFAVQAAEPPYWQTCGTIGLGMLFPTAIDTEGMDGLFVAPIQDRNQQMRLRVMRFRTTGLFQFPD